MRQRSIFRSSVDDYEPEADISSFLLGAVVLTMLTLLVVSALSAA